MSDRENLNLTKKLKKSVQKGFGRKVCQELHFDCASCKAQILIGHLNWYIDSLEWSIKQDKESQKNSK